MKRPSALIPAILFLVCGALFACASGALLLAMQQNKAFSDDHATVDAAKDTQQAITNIQSGKRGFQLTGLNDQLQQYTGAIEQFNAFLRDAKALVKDEPERVAALDRVDKVMTRWVTEIAAPGIQKRKEVDEGTAQIGEIELMIKSQDGTELISRANQELDGVIAAEQQEIAEREEKVALGQTVLAALMVLGLLLSVIGAGILYRAE